MSAIELAINDLNSQEKPNIQETANRYGVKRSTLSRRWRGKTGSKADGIENKSLLNKQQEQALINEINRTFCFWYTTYSLNSLCFCL